MDRSGKFLLFLAIWIVGTTALFAASPAENRAWAVAEKAFNDRIWARAESEFAALLEKYPKTERRAEIILYQAQARFHQRNALGTISLLTDNREGAGNLADEYCFWIAEAHFQQGEFARAAERYLELLKQYPTSRRRIAALVGEAAAYARLSNWERVRAELGGSDSEFAKAARQTPLDANIASGLALLAEAQWQAQDPAGTVATLAALEDRHFDISMDWRVARLRCRALFALGRLPEALAASTNWVALAASLGEDGNAATAESVAVQAEVLERLGRQAEAGAVLQQNLLPTVPEERQRQALVRVTELALAENRVAEAGSNLVRFLDRTNASPGLLAEATLSLGEIRLRQAASLLRSNPPSANAEATNLLVTALGLFDRVLSTQTNATTGGRAEAGKGWCFWLRGEMSECAAAFDRAANHMKDSEDSLLARYKQGDAFFAQKDYSRALPAYQVAAAGLAQETNLPSALILDLQHQLLRTSLELTNTSVASAAMDQIVHLQPHTELTIQSLFLLLQGLADSAQPKSARTAYERFISLVPEFKLRPEVELILGRAREREGDWRGAIAGYEQWLQQFPTNVLRPQVEFQLAWANSQVGLATNALQQFTEFIARYPTNELAAQAQWCVADWFFKEPNFPKAEENFKELFLKWPQSSLAREARLMAGRAALEGTRYQDAIGHFTNLTSDVNCPVTLKVRALFAYGSALMAQRSASTNQLANYEEAIRVFDQIRLSYPTNELSALAAVEMARCWLQFPPETGVTNAWTAFTSVVTNTAVSLVARSEAQVGRGQLLEAMARTAAGLEQTNLLRRALDDYLDIVYEKNLLLAGETRDPFWVNKAALAALPVLETLGELEQAERLCVRLQQLLPPLRATFERRAEFFRARRQTGSGAPGG